MLERICCAQRIQHGNSSAEIEQSNVREKKRELKEKQPNQENEMKTQTNVICFYNVFVS